jgi:hypothetical protein
MRRMFRTAATVLVGLILAFAPGYGQQPSSNQSPARAGGSILGRPSPPQPVQKQGVEYLVGAWNFTWTGRESAVTPGPRTGTVRFTRLGETPSLEMSVVGKTDAGAGYKENGTLVWQASTRTLAMHETLANGVSMLSVADWSSPIALRFESAPVRVKGEVVRLRRIYTIISATSFTVNEELSTNGGPFVRLGGGVFSRIK